MLKMVEEKQEEKVPEEEEEKDDVVSKEAVEVEVEEGKEEDPDWEDQEDSIDFDNLPGDQRQRWEVLGLDV